MYASYIQTQIKHLPLVRTRPDSPNIITNNISNILLVLLEVVCLEMKEHLWSNITLDPILQRISSPHNAKLLKPCFHEEYSKPRYCPECVWTLEAGGPRMNSSYTLSHYDRGLGFIHFHPPPELPWRSSTHPSRHWRDLHGPNVLYRSEEAPSDKASINMFTAVNHYHDSRKGRKWFLCRALVMKSIERKEDYKLYNVLLFYYIKISTFSKLFLMKFIRRNENGHNWGNCCHTRRVRYELSKNLMRNVIDHIKILFRLENGFLEKAERLKHWWNMKSWRIQNKLHLNNISYYVLERGLPFLRCHGPPNVNNLQSM